MAIVPILAQGILPVLVLATLTGPAVASGAEAPSIDPGTSTVDTLRVPPIPPCVANQLVVSSAPHPGGGAAGHYGVLVMFTNVSSTTCTLSGYPDVTFVTGPAGVQINQPAEPNGSDVTTVVLGQSVTALAALYMSNVDMYSPEQCQPVTAAGIRVRVPGTTDLRYVPTPHRVCSVNGVGVPSISPVRARL